MVLVLIQNDRAQILVLLLSVEILALLSPEPGFYSH